jgi:S-formylglutathione hydrolase FrmB
MARCELNFKSAVLGKAQACYVLLPNSIEKGKEYPVLYLLHGYSDDYTIWQRHTSIELYTMDMDLVVVMPDGGHEFYTNAETGYDYETFLIEELPVLIENCFPVSTERSRRGIGGLSMGGYGAIRLGLKYPERFMSVTSHSGAFDIQAKMKSIDPLVHLHRIFGKTVKGTDNDVFYLIEQADAKSLPAIKFDCGVDDHLIEDNRKLAKALTEKGIPFQYDEYPGEHNWWFWDEHIKEALQFHMEQFK